MKVAIGADHGGFILKEKLLEPLAAMGHQIVDFGTESTASCDYPDFAQAVGEAVAEGRVDRGVLICTTGIGMAMAANKVAGVRAAPAQSADEVRMTRDHNDANILALGAKYVDERAALILLRVFLETEFSGGDRHLRRISKIAQLEHV
jgi:ribose 5-phosphate isomerase B